MRRLIDAFLDPSDELVHGLTIANLVANIGIVVTGGAVRLTGSGLGCPTWPRCTEDSLTPHSALGVNGVIEFGNRLLTYVLIAVAVATWFAILRWRPMRRSALILATVIALGEEGQEGLADLRGGQDGGHRWADICQPAGLGSRTFV